MNKKYKQMEPSKEPLVFNFKTTDFVTGIIINLIDNNPYSKLTIDIWFEQLYVGSYDVPHAFDIEDDYLGRSLAIFKTLFKPFKTTENIKVQIKTKLLHNDLITMKLLTTL